MRAVTTVRQAPLQAAVRLQTIRTADPDAGMTTAEYAVGTVAVCGFGGVLAALIKSDFVLSLLKGLLSKALNISF